MKERLIIYCAFTTLIALTLTVYDYYNQQVEALSEHQRMSEKVYMSVTRAYNEQLIKRVNAESELERMSIYYDDIIRRNNIKYTQLQHELNVLKAQR